MCPPSPDPPLFVPDTSICLNLKLRRTRVIELEKFEPVENVRINILYHYDNK